MKFISQNGTEVLWKSTAQIVRRTLCLEFKNRSTWTEDKFLNLVWKHTGLLCISVRLKSVYRILEEKSVAHAYELTFQTGPGFSLQTRRDVNNLVGEIENDIINTLHVTLRGETHRPKSLATEHEINTFGQEKDIKN